MFFVNFKEPRSLNCQKMWHIFSRGACYQKLSGQATYCSTLRNSRWLLSTAHVAHMCKIGSEMCYNGSGVTIRISITTMSASQQPSTGMHTVWKMDLILRSIQRRPQMQFSIGRKFTLWHYADKTESSAKKPHIRNLTFDAPCLEKSK